MRKRIKFKQEIAKQAASDWALLTKVAEATGKSPFTVYRWFLHSEMPAFNYAVIRIVSEHFNTTIDELITEN